jgi:hypothetical protein
MAAIRRRARKQVEKVMKNWSRSSLGCWGERVREEKKGRGAK